MDEFIRTETLLIELLVVVALVAMTVRRLRIPYTVALVLAGLAITFRQAAAFELTPGLILALFVPPLVFEAAFRINVADLRRDLPGVLILAVPGVILTTFAVAMIVSWTTPLGLPVALVFGAIIAATDPVAVVATFRTLGIPKRLGIMVEGESLLNDGTAIVLFGIVLGVALTNSFDVAEGVLDFLRVTVVGVMVGLALGWIVSQLIAMVDDYLIETTLTTVLAFGAYLLAERLQVSGVLAVVAAGLINGNLGPKGMSPTTRIVLSNFWEYVAFLANSLVFLLIGLRIDVFALALAWQPILAAVAATLVARVLVVYGLGLVAGRLAEPVPLRWQHVLAWSGLRGAVSLALALALPSALSDRGLVQVMTFGVVLFTLVGQGTTMGLLLRWLRVVPRDKVQIEFETRHARLAALLTGESHLARMHGEGLLSTHTWDTLRPMITERAASLAAEVRDMLRANPSLELGELQMARREFLRAERGALLDLRRNGMVSDEAFDKLAAEIDTALDSLDVGDTDKEGGAHGG